MDAVLFIAYISILSPILPIGLSAFARKSVFEIKIIRILLIGSFAFDLISLFFGLKRMNTYPFTNFFFLFQAILLFILYHKELKIGLNYIGVAIVYSIVFLMNYFFIEGPFILNSYSFSLSCVIFILLSLLYFRHLLKEPQNEMAYRLPMVWINLAVIIYYSGTLFLFIVNNFLSLGWQGNQRTMWILHNMLNITKNLLFLVAIWQSLRKTNSSSS